MFEKKKVYTDKFEPIYDAFEHVKRVRSGKIDILNIYVETPLLVDVLKFLVDSDITTGLSTKRINKFDNGEHYDTVIKYSEDFIKYLKTNNTGSDEAIKNVMGYINKFENPEVREFLKGIATKTYKLGIDVKTANKFFAMNGIEPIQTWEVQLGTPIDKCNIPEGTYFYLSKKLNGVRASYHGYVNGYRLMSRQGKEYTGCEHIINDLKILGIGENFFVDGELIYKNKEGLSDSDAFQKGSGLANRKDADKSDLKLVLFDCFVSSNTRYSARKSFLLDLKEKIEQLHLENVEVVEMVYEGTNQKEIWKWLDYAEEHDWEGIMINLDTPYEFKRTKNLIKVKKFYDISLRVVDVILSESGRYKGQMGALRCKLYDTTVDVGYGFVDEERKAFAENPSDIIGKIINIKYKEPTRNKQGGVSIQFGGFECIRYDKDIPDDEDETFEFWRN